MCIVPMTSHNLALNFLQLGENLFFTGHPISYYKKWTFIDPEAKLGFKKTECKQVKLSTFRQKKDNHFLKQG